MFEQKKCKNICVEWCKVYDVGVIFWWFIGDCIIDVDWCFFLCCYWQIYCEYYLSLYLNFDFFCMIGVMMFENLLFVIVEVDGQLIVSVFVVYWCGEYGGGMLYGCYWGVIEYVFCLYFEMVYYQLFEFCIEVGFDMFEGGVQGEYKFVCGFLLIVMYFVYWFVYLVFFDVVVCFFECEIVYIYVYVDELCEYDLFWCSIGQCDLVCWYVVKLCMVLLYMV